MAELYAGPRDREGEASPFHMISDRLKPTQTPEGWQKSQGNTSPLLQPPSSFGPTSLQPPAPSAHRGTRIWDGVPGSLAQRPGSQNTPSMAALPGN